jgi:hypothetical protein
VDTCAGSSVVTNRGEPSMGTEENKAVVRRFMSEVVGGGNLDVADEVLAPNYVNLAMGGPTSPASRRWSLPPLPWSKNSGSTTRS